MGSENRQLLKNFTMKGYRVQQLEGSKDLNHFDFGVLKTNETQACLLAERRKPIESKKEKL